ncbi:MAG: prephenate dehydrogenase/arogenate dehydrogenase family protein, partial [Rikenellaceae bacterium]|nr:prephenate dehydrogenase/arogenate dehydrogenase family protein [Rikenellaceae bacterium]
MDIAVIGVGLIGGSFALAMRDKGVARRIIGVDNSESNCRTALDMGLVDEIMPFDEALACCGLVVIAIPVDAIPLVAVKALNRVRKDQIIIDMMSLIQLSEPTRLSRISEAGLR